MKSENQKLATAISYKKGNNAPIVVASGKSTVADRIIKIANENDIPIHVDPECAKLLSLVEVDREIPPELYEVVAKILVFVSDVDKNFN